MDSASTKTTTYKTTTSYSSDTPVYKRRSTMTAHPMVINRSSHSGGMGGMGGRMSMDRSMQYGTVSMPAGSFQMTTTTGVNNVRDTRVQEKRDMQGLNERFASYIEKVRFLEAQNKKLSDELEKLKSLWGKETSKIKSMYEVELAQAKKLREDAETEKNKLEIKLTTLETELDELKLALGISQDEEEKQRSRLEAQDQDLAEMRSEQELLRKRINHADGVNARNANEIARLTDALSCARIDLDSETLCHCNAANNCQTLQEELEFQRRVHEQELKELAALAMRDTTSENRTFWKNEMGLALREIQDTYDDKLNTMRGELQTSYDMKIQEFRTGATRQNLESTHAKDETKRLRSQLGDLRGRIAELEGINAHLTSTENSLKMEYESRLSEMMMENEELKMESSKLRAEMEAILKELQDLMDTKLGLELEIAAYRKLLEGEENRTGLRSVVDTFMSSSTMQEYSDEDSSLKVNQVVKGEMSAKTTYQRSAKGPVSISECSADGKFVCLENTGRKDEALGGWRIKRSVDNVDKADFTFDQAFKLRSSARIKIWAQGSKPMNASSNDLECQASSWGIGANITTKLINPANEDRATHIQKTVYTS